MPMHSARISRRSRTLAAVAVAATGGLLFAGPLPSAQAVDVGTVTYSGNVSCEGRYPAPNLSVPTKVTLSGGQGSISDGVDNNGARTAPYGPVDVKVPLDANFQLRVVVTCKVPGHQVNKFNRSITQSGLDDEQEITLNLQ
ncbi:hypothetical protein [Streptomyces sp. NPDC002676]